MIDELRPRHQLVDLARCASGGFRLFGDEGADLLDRRRQPDQVVGNAAEKFGIGGQFGRQNLDALQLGRDVLIDVIVLGKRGPLEALLFR